MKKLLLLCLTASIALCMSSCDGILSGNNSTVESSVPLTSESTVTAETDYLVLVNRTHKLPDNYEQSIELLDGKNFFGENFRLEKETYDHFEQLREKMLMQEIQIEVNRGYLTAEEQNALIASYTEEYGKEYAYNYLGEPYYSEYQTGLSIDLALYFAGEKINTDKALTEAEGILHEIHGVMAEYGFILRYPDEKVQTTDFMYEPWHIRYVGTDAAKEIYAKNITLEEYLNN